MPKPPLLSQLELGTETRQAPAAGPTSGSPEGISPAGISGSASTASTFEESVRRLTAIVEQLERGQLPLEDSLRLFEEGVELARASQAQLDFAEKRVEELLAIDERGRPIVRGRDWSPPEQNRESESSGALAPGEASRSGGTKSGAS
ncbi:MAG TPA: exodeoxyribonuclease VII small subunit [Polyangiaceae bacterium]|jgi:exodeoxyribonuclease VII small subunit